MVQLSHLYVTAGKTKALTRQTFVGKVTILIFNILSRLVIAFLPKSKHLLISWLQSPSAVILKSNKIKSVTVSIVSPSICSEVMRPDATFSECLFFFVFHLFVFWTLSFKLTFSLFSFTFIKRLFSSSLLSAVRMVSSAYLRLLILLPAILIPACASSSPEFHMMYSAYKLNKQGDNIQPWYTSFPIWNHSIVPCRVLTVASWPAYEFLRRQVRWSGIPISWRIIHSLLWSTQSKTLSLDCKEVKPVNPKRNKSWIFIGRTDAEAEAPILWPHDVKNWLIGKVPGAGQDGRQEEKGMTEEEMVGWYHQLCGHEFEQAPGVGDGQRGLACWVHGVSKSQTRLSDWTGWLTDYPSELGIGIASCRKLFLTLKQSSITLLFTSTARNKQGWKKSKGVPRSSFYWLST